MGSTCTCFNKGDKESEKDVAACMTETPQSSEFKAYRSQMIEEVREIYEEFLKGYTENVKSLKIVGKELTHVSVNSISLIVPDLRNLTEIELRSNNLKFEDFQRIFNSMLKNQRISKLFIIENGIDDEGAEYLSTILPCFEYLQYLCLDDNKISKVGCRALKEGLVTLTGLKGFSVRNNEINKKGALYLAKALKNLSGLEYFYVGSERIGEECVERIKAILPGVRTEEKVIYEL